MKRAPRTRSAKDPRVVEIMAALERVIDSPTREQSCLDYAACTIINTCLDRFTVPAMWSDAAVRAVVLAFALHAPDEDLDDMVTNAREVVASTLEYEVHRAIEDTGATARPSHAEAN